LFFHRFVAAFLVSYLKYLIDDNFLIKILSDIKNKNQKRFCDIFDIFIEKMLKFLSLNKFNR